MKKVFTLLFTLVEKARLSLCLPVLSDSLCALCCGRAWAEKEKGQRERKKTKKREEEEWTRESFFFFFFFVHSDDQFFFSLLPLSLPSQNQ